ncbi:adenylate/guanylate cyclase domain-containing protein [Agromyces aurantiacus]|uniref:Adenylate/guanylate cyclase domain-containing protein n=1 Tax=Agromyces aurantiacus TaxID=165814 RepID=A0ABV9R7B3_9MICO|nr:adenylate/guanylate cyclase domain-containing protein [Agromyces aurantiacus]MBM7504359.1 class 3 adenylate cyclase [Agromyces aurantiacus]
MTSIAPGTGPTAPPPTRTSLALTAAALAVPVIGLVMLVARPALDLQWEHQPTHFWLVLAVGAINAALAWVVGAAARLRRDARLVLVSLSFLSAAGFLALHALATPGVLLAESNTGFALATPAGLTLASVFAAWSSLDLDGERGARVVRLAPWLVGGVLALMLLWGAVSLLRLGPLDAAAPPERTTVPFAILAAVGLACYVFAVVRYLRMPRHAASPLPLAFAAAFTLLAEAEIAVVVGRNWHLSWWEWHVLMLAAFVIIAVAAQRSWREERWAGLYTRDTAAGERDVSVLFADLAGFTRFSETHEPAEVTAMLNTYFGDAIPPLVERFGGRVDRLIGDAVMAVFETDAGSGASHAHRAAGAALALQQATGAVAAAHPDWPRFRVGVNSGVANVGVLGTGGGRTYTVIGDTVNVASRIEHRAPVGGVAIAAGTRERLGSAAITEPLGALEVAGREAPVETHLLVGLAGS